MLKLNVFMNYVFPNYFVFPNSGNSFFQNDEEKVDFYYLKFKLKYFVTLNIWTN